MTCIVALRGADHLIVGADRLASDGWLRYQIAHPKIMDHNGVIVGVSGSVRLAQVIDHELDWEDLTMRLKAGDDPYPWAVTKLVPAIRSTLGDHAALKVENSVAEAPDSAALVAVAGRIFVIHSDLQVFESAEKYAAVGSGSHVALGSLYSTEMNPDTAARVTVALAAAERHVPSVGAPFDLIAQPSTLTPD